jgi:hypothetical protein
LVVYHPNSEVKIDLNPYTNSIQLGESVNQIEMICLNSGCIAVMTKNETIDLLTVWDHKYGTLQLKRTINRHEKAEEREFCLKSGSSSVHGDILLLGLSLKTESNSIGTLFSIFPYHSPKINLLAAVGKLTKKESSFDYDTFRGQLSSIVPIVPPFSDRNKPLRMWKAKISEWNSIDEEYLQKLLAPGLVDIENFRLLFIDWLAKKQASLRNWKVEGAPKIKQSAKGTTSRSLLGLQKVELSQRAILLLIDKCFSSRTKFWPSKVVEYLIECGSVSSDMIEGGIMQALVEMQELALIDRAFSKVSDITERDIFNIIDFITISPVACNTKMETFQKWWETRRYKRTGIVPGREKLDKALVVKEVQMYFLHKCFSTSHIHNFLVKELVKLSPNQLLVIFEWIKEIISPVSSDGESGHETFGQYPLWWLWIDNKDKQTCETQFTKYSSVNIVYNLVVGSFGIDCGLSLNNNQNVIRTSAYPPRYFACGQERCPIVFFISGQTSWPFIGYCI